MSTPSPLQLTGSYTRELLSAVLRGIQEQKQSGILHLISDERVGSIHFMQGKLAAADFAEQGGVQAFHEIAATERGRYEFKAGFVQFSQIGMEKRIYATLESLLSSHEVQSFATSEPVPAAIEPLAAFNLQAFDLDILDDNSSPDNRADLEPSAATMRANFSKALLSEFVRSVGPAAYVVIEEIALELRIDLRAMSVVQATRLTAMMLGQVPVSKRSAFQISCANLLEQFKP